MKKVLSLIAILCMALVCFAGCDLFTQTDPETPCEHDWVDATCTDPKTCSLCGETEGEPDALNHKAEADDGDCTTAVKCANCDTIVVAALTHTAEADDGDVTTAVKCANEGCDHIFVPAKAAITLTIPTFENGEVVANKKNYAIGDTIKLEIYPDKNYTQKLYINGEPLLLDWNNDVFTFVAEKDAYVISGSFEQGLDIKAYDPTRWNTMNIAHGVVTTYYPGQPDSWWFDLNGNYQSLEIIAKNYLPLEESMDNQSSNPKVDGYHSVIRMTLSNGKHYAFRLYNDKGTYAVSCSGVSGAVTGWGNWKNVGNLLGYSINDAMAGEGVKFKIERTAANVITISVNGVVMFTYTMDGVTAEDKVTAVGFQHNRNSGEYVDIPFALTEACDHAWDAATCTTPKTCLECGETVGTELGHSYTNYTSNNDATCTVDGTKTAQCDNCTEKDTVVDAGSAGHKDTDGDLKCNSCGDNMCEEHEAEDDGNCLTEVKCAKCGEILLAAASDHKPEADDGDVTTEVKCTNKGCNHIVVPAKEAIDFTIPTFENGTITADKKNYAVGDTVTLTVSPANDYAQKLYINGEAILVDTNSKYSFVVEEGKTYNITGEFVNVKGKWYWTNNGEFGLLNQAHGIISCPAHPGKDATGELVPTLNKYYGGKVLVTDPFKGTKKDYAIVLKMKFSDGSQAAIRLVNKDGNGHYMVQTFGLDGNLLSNGNKDKNTWTWYYDLNAEENAAVANGEGVWFSLVREGTNIKVAVNGSVKTRNDVTVNVPVDVVLSEFKVQAYNYDKAVDLKYEFYMTE